jgi:thymidylate synthase
MSDGFPLITTKKMYWKGISTELIWFLRGDTNIKFLVDNDCHIWDGDAYKNYEKWYNEYSGKEDYTGYYVPNKEEFIRLIKTDDEFAKKWGDLGPIYGKQWRSWGGFKNEPSGWNHGAVTHYREVPKCDQIANLINDLKTNPDSRRLMVNAWNPSDLESSVLPPCHYGFQVYTRELSLEERTEYKKKIDGISRTFASYTHQMLDSSNIPTRAISLSWNQRSVDTFLGLPFNIASYGLLLEIIAKEVNMVPDELIGNLGDTHLYSNHIEQAKEQIGKSYTHEERTKMLKDAMSHRIYNKTVNELMPFGGGMSEYYESYKIPKRTRQPYPLPTLKINSGNENWHLLEIDEIINSLDPDITFKVENYQSHSTIKAPLSN